MIYVLALFNFLFNYNTRKYYNRFTVGKILIYKNLSKGSGYFRTLWIGVLLVIDMISLLELSAVLVYVVQFVNWNFIFVPLHEY